MAEISIHSHQELLDLTQHLQFPNGVLLVKLVRLGHLDTVGTALDLMLGFIHPRPWSCKNLDALESYCAFNNDLDQIVQSLLPTAQNAQVLNNVSSPALAGIKSRARAMKSGMCHWPGIRENSEMYRSAIQFADTIYGIVDDVLRGVTPYNDFLAIIPDLNDQIQALKNTDMEFS